MTVRSALMRLQAHPLSEDLRLPTGPRGGTALTDETLEALAADLLERFRRHEDVEAFAFLVELSRERLLRVARRIVRSQSSYLEAEDLVAGFLARLFTDTRPDRPRVDHLLAMGYTMMRYEALTAARGQRRAQRRQERYGSLVHTHRVALDPAEVVEGRERLERLGRRGTLLLWLVARCFAALPDRDRRALTLRELHQLSYDQIAHGLDVPRTQVGMVLKRARQRLVRRLDEALSCAGVGSSAVVRRTRPAWRPSRLLPRSDHA